MVALCRRFLGDRAATDDIVQEATLQAWLELTRLRQRDQFGAWYAGIGLNCCRRDLRRQYRQGRLWEEMSGGRYISHSDDALDPAIQIAEREQDAHLGRAIELLPPGQRAAVRRFYLDGLTQAETATALGIPIGAVKTRLHKARANLHRLLTNPTDVTHQPRDWRSEMIEMQITDVRRQRTDDGSSQAHVVILTDTHGQHRLPIWMGDFEATAIALHLENIAPPRPLTYALTASLLSASGAAVREVRIDQLVNDVFIASIVVEGSSGARTVDARPSDALNLALLTDAPIRVDSSVLDAVAAHPSGAAREGAGPEAAGVAEIVSDARDAWARAGVTPSTTDE